MNAIRSTVTAFALASSLAAAASADDVAPGVGRFARAGDFGTDVTVRWTLQAPKPQRGDDPGQHVVSGSVAVTSGADRTNTLVSLATLRVLPPNVAQTVPLDAGTACGASGPIAIVALAGSTAPAAIVTTVAIGRGCLPIPHALLPLDDRSHRYALAAVYAVARSLASPDPGSPANKIATLRIARARAITIPVPAGAPTVPNLAPRHMSIVDGVDAAGRHTEIALDYGTAPATSLAGNTIRIEDEPNGYEGMAVVTPAPR